MKSYEVHVCFSLPFPDHFEFVVLNYSSENELRYELNMEIERSKELLEKASQKLPDSVPRSRGGRIVGQSEDPKMAEVVRFYEDLTNLLVTDVKPQPARYLHFEDWLLTCVYSYRDVVSKEVPSKSVFSRLCLCLRTYSSLWRPVV